jgi:hypothetical protein
MSTATPTPNRRQVFIDTLEFYAATVGEKTEIENIPCGCTRVVVGHYPDGIPVIDAVYICDGSVMARSTDEQQEVKAA